MSIPVCRGRIDASTKPKRLEFLSFAARPVYAQPIAVDQVAGFDDPPVPVFLVLEVFPEGIGCLGE